MTLKDVFARFTELSFLIGATWSLLLYIVPLLTPYITGLELVPWMVAVPWLPVLLVVGGLLNALTWERGWYLGKAKIIKTAQRAEDDRTQKWKITLAHMIVAALVLLIYPSILAGVYYMISMALLYVVSRVVTKNIKFVNPEKTIEKDDKKYKSMKLGAIKNTFDKVDIISSRMKFLVLGIVTLAVFQAFVFSATSALFAVSMGILSFVAIMGLVFVSRRLESYSAYYKKFRDSTLSSGILPKKSRFIGGQNRERRKETFSSNKKLMKTHCEDLEVLTVRYSGEYSWTENIYVSGGRKAYQVETVKDNSSLFRKLCKNDVDQIKKMKEKIVDSLKTRIVYISEGELIKNVENSIECLKKCFEGPRWYQRNVVPYHYFVCVPSNKLDEENISELFNMQGRLERNVLCRMTDKDYSKAFENKNFIINKNLEPFGLKLYAAPDRKFSYDGEWYIPVYGCKKGNIFVENSEYLYMNAIKENNFHSDDFSAIDHSKLTLLVGDQPIDVGGQLYRDPASDIKTNKELKKMITKKARNLISDYRPNRTM